MTYKTTSFHFYILPVILICATVFAYYNDLNLIVIAVCGLAAFMASLSDHLTIIVNEDTFNIRYSNLFGRLMSTDWTVISNSFLADSNYAYINIGNFFDDTHINMQIQNPTASISYYYFDDVRLSTDSAFTTGIKKDIEPKISFYPNPTSDQSTLQFDNAKAELCTLTLYDLRGQTMRTINNITSDQVVIQKNDLQNGLYYFVLRTSDRVILTGKLAVD